MRMEQTPVRDGPRLVWQRASHRRNMRGRGQPQSESAQGTCQRFEVALVDAESRLADGVEGIDPIPGG